MTDTAKAWIEERRKVQDGASSWGTSGTAASIELARAQGERAEHYEVLLTAVEKVLELHVKGYETAGAHWCSECETLWPCATVQAIEGAINE